MKTTAYRIKMMARSVPAVLLLASCAGAMKMDRSLLHRRMQELASSESLPVVMLPETMLPRQRIRLPNFNPWLEQLMRTNGFTRIGVLSRASPLSGVEATLIRDTNTLVGGRCFTLTESESVSVGTCVHTSVRWLDLALADEMSASETPSRAVELTARELGPLVNRWLHLLASHEGGRGIKKELVALGALPGIDRPSERALWCAALLNPYGCRYDARSDGCDVDGCGSLWPALEIRDTVLTAPTAVARLSAAKTGLVDSIYKLKGGEWPMNTYYW